MTTEEIELANQAIEQAPTDQEMTIREMFGDDWGQVVDVNNFGKDFKAAVLGNEFPRIRWVRLRSDNQNIYVKDE